MKVTIVNCFDTYEQRVDMVLSFFKNRGDDVKVYTSDFRHFKKIKRDDVKDHYIFFGAKPYYKNLSVARLKSHSQLAKDIFIRLRKEQNDLLWILLPPNSFVREAKKFKIQNPQTKVIFDIMDMWPETMPIGKLKSFFPFTIWKNLRDKNIACADLVVTECDLFKKKLQKYVASEKMKTIYLARDVEKYKENVNIPKDVLSLCYLGSINNIIDINVIQNIIKSLALNKKVKLHIIGDGEKRQELLEKSEQAGAEVIYHGKVYDLEEKQRIFSVCHYGLNIMKESVYVGLTMKSIDYFEAGLPVINNIKGDTWKFVEKEKIGYNLDSNTDYDAVAEYDVDMRRRTKNFFENTFSTTCFFNALEKIELE